MFAGMNTTASTRSEVQTQTASVSLAQRVAWISGLAILTGLSALVRIPLPFTPVPITLQTLVVVSGAVILGRDGVYAQILYLLLGCVGLPFFAGQTAGFQYLFGATGGYLVGFVLAAAWAAKWVRPTWTTDSFWVRSAKLFIVSFAILIPGVLQLAFVANLSIGKAIMLGCVPFLIGDVIKTLIAAATPSKLLR